MKSKFNELVHSKSEIQGELIQSEEEKLKVSKALIEKEIENTKLKQTIQEETFKVNSQLLHADNDILEQNIKSEKQAQVILELQDKLRDSLEEKREFEIEFVALKKNYLNVKQDLEHERVKNENIGLEIVNLVNENKVLQSQKKFVGEQKEQVDVKRD